MKWLSNHVKCDDIKKGFHEKKHDIKIVLWFYFFYDHLIFPKIVKKKLPKMSFFKIKAALKFNFHMMRPNSKL